MVRRQPAPASNIPGCGAIRLPQDGDCFYEAVHRAFASAGRSAADDCGEPETMEGERPTRRLRRRVAREVDGAVYETFAMLYAAGLDDYAFMRRCGTAEQLRAKIRVCGAESGTTRCVWANDFEITTLCRALTMTALIVDAEAPEGQRFVALPPTSEQTDPHNRTYVVLLRCDRAHFNLAAFDDASLFDGADALPPAVAAAFSLPAPRPSSRKRPAAAAVAPQSPRKKPAAAAAARIPPPAARKPAAKKAAAPAAFPCPGCGKAFGTAQALGAHGSRSKSCAGAPPQKMPKPSSRAVFRAYEEPWERAALRDATPAAEARLLNKYGGRRFSDPDFSGVGVLKVVPKNLEWGGKKWHALTTPAGAKNLRRIEAYLVNGELRRMIAATAQVPPCAVEKRRPR